MTVLRSILCDIVRAHGPIDVGRFMALCALHRERGYYAASPAIGAGGDFVTAPEISQLFGELLGLALAAYWQRLGEPSDIRLVELGPGTGALMSDLWRAAAAVPGLRAAVRSVDLVEASPKLRELQASRLRGLPLRFHDSVESLPDELPLFVVANEFFDALPVRQFVCTEDGLRERLVAVDREGRLAFILAPRPLPAASFPDIASLPAGRVIEIAPAREAVAASLAAKLVAAGGIALIVDYGEAGLPAGDTLQAVHRHRRVDALAAPGEADLSSHVDFAALARAARATGAAGFGPVPQGEFLRRLGVALRLERLCAAADAGTAQRLHRGVARLVAPDAMGMLFKVLALVPRGAPVPPGFVEGEARP